MHRSLALLACLVLPGTLAIPSAAQGRTDYLNVETPQAKPITWAQVGGHDYLLVCNTPDNSVEIWSCDESIQPATSRFVARVPVGLEPSSVVWNPALGRFFTTDFLSDSVTIVVLDAPNGPASLTFAVERTKNVGDEPVHLAFTPDNSTILVTFKSEHAVGAFGANTLDPIAPTAVLPAPTDQIDLVGSSGLDAIKEPRTIAVANGQMFVLGHKGGNDPATFDLDLRSLDLTTGSVWSTGGLSSTNTNMAFGADGTLYTTGGLARNRELIGGPAVAGAATGFVRTMLHRVSSPGTANASVTSLDLNEHFNPATQQVEPVAFDDALAIPTDVAIHDAGNGPKVFIAAMGSDRIGVITPDAGAPEAWARSVIDIPVVTPGNRASGPRGLAIVPFNLAALTAARLYSLNRLDNSVTVIDPISETIVDSFPLAQDPTPFYIRDGRPFLYDAKLSANGFVSCASCHSDGRTDALGWDLGSPTGFVAPFGRFFADGPTSTTLQQLAGFVQNGFDPDKRLMVTQSLQGLLNFEIDPGAQEYTTNAPYHWRGDRDDFTKFQEAFVNLFGLPNIGTPSDPMGIPAADMDRFEEFINSIHYPPNPNQPLDRVYSGSAGAPNQNDGSGAVRGLKLFHIQPLSITQGRSCVQCHALSEGSNNRFTVRQAGGVPLAPTRQPLETAAMRGLLQKQTLLERQPAVNGTLVIGDSGLEHAGRVPTLNAFVDIFQGQFLPDELADVKRFAFEFDTGVAPSVGQVEPVFFPVTAANQNRITLFESQVYAANAELAVRFFTQNFSVHRAFTFDPTRDSYVEEGAGAGGAVLTRSQLLALVDNARERMTFFSTPLGSGRRIADPDGNADPVTPTTPTQLTFMRMVPNTANATVPLMTKNWVPGAGPTSFQWNHPQNLPTPLTLHAMRLMQLGLMQAGNYGVRNQRHDAPRRFRVRGSGLQAGALLWVHTPEDPAAPVIDPNGPLNQVQTRALRIPIFPTGQPAAAEGHAVGADIGGSGSEIGTIGPVEMTAGTNLWESAIELDQMTYYTMMVGGPFAPGVQEALTDFNALIPESSTSTSFDPDNFNWHFIQVQNPGQAPVDLGWRQLRVRG